MKHYKSWSGLNKQLNECLCDSLRNRVSYFLTRYHKVHNSYGRASIKLDGRELVVFSWIDMYKQDSDMNERWEETGVWDDTLDLRNKWQEEGTLSDWDFLQAATDFLQMLQTPPVNNGTSYQINHLLSLYVSLYYPLTFFRISTTLYQ